MKIITPCLSFFYKRQTEKIENNYLMVSKYKGETDIQYLSNWLIFKEIYFQRMVSLLNNCKYLSDSFFDMMTKHKETLIQILFDEISNDNHKFLDFNGVLFHRKVGCILQIKTHLISFTIFDKSMGLPIIKGEIDMISESYSDESIPYDIKTTFFLSESEKLYPKKDILRYILQFVMCVILEKKIEKKEIIIIPPNGKKKIQNEKYVNENPIGIEIWDSRLFYDYVRLEGFSVKGHFRNQRVGNGRLNQKLIWINDFEKKGYNRNHLPNDIN